MMPKIRLKVFYKYQNKKKKIQQQRTMDCDKINLLILQYTKININLNMLHILKKYISCYYL